MFLIRLRYSLWPGRRQMNDFIKIGLWILIAAVLILPLYELADYSELWHHDGDLILSALVLLVIGMALLSAKRLARAVSNLVHQLRTCIRQTLRVDVVRVAHFCKSCWSPPPTDLTSIYCDLRI